MIDKVMYNSRTTEVAALSTRLLGAYNTTDLQSDSQLSNMFAGLDSKNKKLLDAIMRNKVESELEGKDNVRDDRLRALYYQVWGYCHHPVEDIKSAALKVKKVFDRYGLSIIGENYATESALLNSLLGDMNAPEIQDALALLSGCPENLAALKSAQNDFENARIVYEQNKAHEGSFENASEIKKELLVIINEMIIAYLRVMVKVNEPGYEEFSSTIATIIKDNNIAVKRRIASDE